MGLFTTVKKYGIYSAVYTYDDMNGYYTLEDKTAESLEDLDKFASEIMEELGYPRPYHRMSVHRTGYEKRRVRK